MSYIKAQSFLHDSSNSSQEPIIIIGSNASAANMSSSEAVEDDGAVDQNYFLPASHRQLGLIVYIVLTVIGVIGNVLVLLVITQIREMHASVNYYLLSLALSDLLTFASVMPKQLISYFVPVSVHVFGSAMCPVLTFLPYLAINVSSLTLTLMTIERFVAICYPIKAKVICKTGRTKIIILILWVISVVYNSPWLFLVHTKPIANPHPDWPNSTSCTFKVDRRLYTPIFLIDFLLFYVTPLLLYLILYWRIAYTLSHRLRVYDLPSSESMIRKTTAANNSTATNNKRKVNNNFSSPSFKKSYSQSSQLNKVECSTQQLNGSGPAKKLSVTSRLLKFDKQQQPTQRSNDYDETIALRRSYSRGVDDSLNASIRTARQRTASRAQVVRMLIVVVSVFALCWLPYRGMVVYNSFRSRPWSNQWYFFFAKTLIIANSSVNPILYSLMSQKFRKGFLALCHCQKSIIPKQSYSTASMTMSAAQNSKMSVAAAYERPAAVLSSTINYSSKQQRTTTTTTTLQTVASRSRSTSSIVDDDVVQLSFNNHHTPQIIAL